MSRQPVVGGDANAWGSILNDYLSVSLSNTGTLNPISTGLQFGATSTAIIVKKDVGGTAGTQPILVLSPLSTEHGSDNASLVLVPTSTSNTAQLNSQYVLYNRPGGERWAIQFYNGNLIQDSTVSTTSFSVTPMQFQIGGLPVCMMNTLGYLGVGPASQVSDANILTDLHVLRSTSANREFIRITGDITQSGNGAIFFDSTSAGSVKYGIGQIQAASGFDLRQLPGGTYILHFDQNGVAQFTNKIQPGTDAGATQTASGMFAGTGAPNNANGANGDFYFRSDGGALTTIYQRRAGAWVGIV